MRATCALALLLGGCSSMLGIHELPAREDGGPPVPADAELGADAGDDAAPPADDAAPPADDAAVDAAAASDAAPPRDAAAPPDAAPPPADASLDAPRPALLTWTPTQQDLGSAVVGTSGATARFTLANQGDVGAPLAVQLVPATDFALAVNGCPSALAGGASCEVTVRLTPSAAGVRSAQLRATAAGPAVQLTGTGLTPGALAISPASLDFGVAALPTTSAAMTVTARNSGGAPLMLGATTLSAAGFVLSSDGCMGRMLGAGATCAIAVAFQPSAPGAHGASLTVAAVSGERAASILSGTGSARLTVTVSGSGQVTSAPAGIACGATCAADFMQGAVTLTATPAAGMRLAAWSGACTGAGGCALTLRGPTAVAASFTPILHRVTVTPPSGGSVSSSEPPPRIACGADCSEDYAEGTQITLTATPAAGYSFAGWSGDCAGSASCQLRVDRPLALGAGFQRILHRLTVTLAGTGAGALSAPGLICAGTTCSADVPSGTSIVLTASAAAGSDFTGWSDAACPGRGSCTLVMNAPRSLSATFMLPWTYTYDRAAAADVGGAVTTDSAGNIYVGGYISTAPGVTDGYLQRISPQGAPGWSASVDSGGLDVVRGLDCDAAGNLFAAGFVGPPTGDRNIWYARYSAAGAKLWERTISNVGHDLATSITVAPSGRVYVAGFLTSATRGQDAWVAELDPATGNLLWQASHDGGASANDGAGGIAVDPAGNLVLAGQRRLSASAPSDLWILRVRGSDGGLIWSDAYATAGDDLARDVAADAGGFTVSGEALVGATQDGFIRRYNWSNGVVFTRTVGAGYGNDSAWHVAADGAGNLFVVGGEVNAAGDENIVIRRYDTAGSELWLRSHASPGGANDRAHGVTTDAAGNLVVTGSELGADQTPTAPNANLWLRKYYQ